MKIANWLLLIGLLGCATAGVINSTSEKNHPTIQSKTFFSEAYHIDTIYKSMMGPMSTQKIHLGTPHSNQLLWITGYETEMVEADGRTPLSEEFMCHSNLDLDWGRMNNSFNMKHGSTRAFTLSQGQLSVQFPQGFGIPTLANFPFQLATQVLNLNEKHIDLKARHKVTINYIQDDSTNSPYVPLLAISAYGLKALEKGKQHFNIDDVDDSLHGPGCLVGAPARPREFEDLFGQKFTGHWIVPPGKEVNYTNVTKIMNVPFNTTIHYIAVHVHPFAESVELIDLTTGKSVYKSAAQNVSERIGLKHVDFYASEEGIPVYKDHEYQFISIYNNTSGENQDAMAVMYLYLKDKDFRYPPNRQ